MDNATLHIDWASVVFSVNMSKQCEDVSAEMMHVWRARQVGVKNVCNILLSFKIAALESLQLNCLFHIHLSV